MAAHPLDPLSADELRRAAAVLRRDRGVDERWLFASIELREPDKAALLAGEEVPREALVALRDRERRTSHRAVVSLDADRVTAWHDVAGGQPNITIDEYHAADEALRRDPRVVEALAARGIVDLDL